MILFSLMLMILLYFFQTTILQQILLVKNMNLEKMKFILDALVQLDH